MSAKEKTRTLADIDWREKIALARFDFNAPISNGAVADDSRLRAALPTLHYILQQGGGAVCLSHFGRPQEGEGGEKWSLSPIAKRLSELLERPVNFAKTWPRRPPPGEVWLLENTRLNSGESKNDFALAERYAALGDVFVLDAFASAHRAESSLCALALAAKDACAGLLLEKELDALCRAFQSPARPLTAIVGGAKVSDKFGLLSNLLSRCDSLIVGGGIANTFLAAQGFHIGASLAEPSMLSAAEELLSAHGKKILLPVDAIVASSAEEGAATRQLSSARFSEMGEGEKIYDIGEASRCLVGDALRNSGTIIWNGPMGMFECDAFAAGTRALALAVADSSAYSLAGGGDTLAAVNQFQVGKSISHLSTGGGAMLEWLAGRTLPALQSLSEAVARRK